MLYRIADGFIALLLWTCVYVQLNDPDPWMWMVLYGCSAVVATVALLGRKLRPIVWVGVMACLVGLVLTAPGFFRYLTQHFGETLLQEMSADRMYIEETREFLGMAIAGAAMAWYVVRSRTTTVAD